MDKIAIIDMGTNTFHLLLAETDIPGYRVIHREQRAVRIGATGINEGFINEDARLRAVQAMIAFRETIDRFGITSVYAFGTSAFRHAVNAGAVTEEIKSATDITVQVISGEEEANYIFEGIKAALDLGNNANLVIDIGAGSVEFIISNSQDALWTGSFEIGGQRLLERFQRHDPILPSEIQALDTYFEKTLAPLLQALAEFRPSVLIGASGTFDTLSDIFCIRHGLKNNSGAPETPLTLKGFFEIYSELIGKSKRERMQIPGMIELRVDLAVVGSCLIRFLLERHTFERIRVSSYSLKEGVLAKLGV